MSGINVETAQRHLDIWVEAELALAENQSYSLQTANGSRTLTRANLGEISKNIDTWQARLREAEAREKGKSRNRIYRAIPRDF